ncbi:MAG: HesA/MoeB/ThiF family protein [Bacteroidales bacterium]|nr:HesA/MoeB/ThiF family protein [Bacteroidales bacterium]
MTERYNRQMIMPEIGEVGQQRLLKSHVVVVGAGGLGSPVLTYLVNAGIGKITVFEMDTVSVSNLQRQFLYTTHQVGENKATCAAEFLKARNPEVDIVVHNQRFENSEEIRSLVAQADVVVDCSDNYQTRYLINDLCTDYGKPMVYGAINALSGQVAVLCHPNGHATYRTLFPEPPSGGANKAVIGPTPGVIGAMQALQTIMLLVNNDSVLVDKLCDVDLKTMNTSVFEL